MDAQLEVRILGPVGVEVDGRPLRLGAQQRALLAILALQVGRPVTCSRLIELLWGRLAPDGAAATLRSHVRRLRHALEAGTQRGIGATLLTTEGTGGAVGYALRIAPNQLDAARFECLAKEVPEHFFLVSIRARMLFPDERIGCDGVEFREILRAKWSQFEEITGQKWLEIKWHSVIR